MTTQTHLDSIAHLLDDAAREAAHAACDDSTTPEQFAALYLGCLAVECRKAAMEQLGSDEEWSPADWLPGDSDIITEHAELLGVEPEWSKLWELYGHEYAGADSIARSMALADIATADDPAALARKVLSDAENHSGVRSCEWEIPTILHDYQCTEAMAIRAVQLYAAAIIRAAEEHLSA